MKKTKKKKKNPPTPKPQTDTVTTQEKIQLGQTLGAIMKRLSAMETRQAVYLQQAQNFMDLNKVL